MPLQPINFVHLGDAYRFYVDFSAPGLNLSHVEKYESGLTHAEPVDWEDVPVDLKEMLFEKVKHHAPLEI